MVMVPPSHRGSGEAASGGHGHGSGNAAELMGDEVAGENNQSGPHGGGLGTAAAGGGGGVGDGSGKKLRGWVENVAGVPLLCFLMKKGLR